MFAGFLILSVFYLLGSVFANLTGLSIPPAILGLVGLLMCLFIRGRLPTSLASITTTLLPLLPLFLIPASVQIIEFGPMVKQDGVLLLIAMALSVAFSLAIIPFVFVFFIRLFNKNNREAP